MLYRNTQRTLSEKFNKFLSPITGLSSLDYNNILKMHFVCAGQPPVMLSPGIHSFPFKLGLPPGLPSTFLGKSGWVQYYCKAALREPNSLTHKNQQVFIVMNPIDLNMEPSILSVVKHVTYYINNNNENKYIYLHRRWRIQELFKVLKASLEWKEYSLATLSASFFFFIYLDWV